MRILQIKFFNYSLLILLIFLSSWYYISNSNSKLVTASEKSIPSVVTISSNNYSFPQGRNGIGSGVIFSKDGYIVTNLHIISGENINVKLYNGKNFQAKIIGLDKNTDIAILKISADEDFEPINFADSDDLKIGDRVLAIGNPYGIGISVSNGIISATGRDYGNPYLQLIQTDAAINPGNSGGALINENGNLIGINSKIFSRTGAYQGIGFAIPAAFVREFLRQAKSGVKKFEQPWLGVFGQAITPELAEALQLDGFDGMVISALHEKSPLMLAGLSKGDVVVSVDNFAVNGPAEMLFRLTVAGIGSKSKLSIVSGGQRRDLWVELKPAPNDPPSNLKRLPKTSPLRDLIVRIINPAVQQEMGLGLSTRGIVVVEPGPIGSRLGFRSGDIIEEINGTRLISAEQIDELIGTSNRSGQFIISRDGQRLTIRYRT